jgi:hypothetical protein
MQLARLENRAAGVTGCSGPYLTVSATLAAPGTQLVVVGLTAIPARIGARRPSGCEKRPG